MFKRYWNLCFLLIIFVSGCNNDGQIGSKDVDIPPSNPPAKVAIVFVHGVMGGADTTFKSEKGETWPAILSKDARLSVPAYIYSISYRSEPLSKSSNIHEIATRLLARLKDKKFFSDFEQVIFVTHSMGGLITKHMLLQLSSQDEIAYKKVAGVFFLGVPAGGSDLGQLASWISRNPQFEDMEPEDLNTFLQSEEDNWAALLRKRTDKRPYPKTFCIYETLSLGAVKVVPRSSAQTGCDESPIAFDRNHSDLVKPENEKDEVYEHVLARINRIVRYEYSPLEISVELLGTDNNPIAKQMALHTGQGYKIKVTTTAPSWLYVFSEDSADKVVRYFPAEKAGRQKVPTTTIVIPEKEDEYFQLDHVVGIEAIHLLASINRRDDLEKIAVEVGAGGVSAISLKTELQKRGATVANKNKLLSVEMQQRFDVSGAGTDAAASLYFRHVP